MKYKGPRARTVHLTAEEYHNDASWFREPSLSASLAHVLVSKSPLHAYVQHPRLGGDRAPRQASKPMQDGQLIHKLMLGRGRDVVLIDAPDFRTDAARAARDAAFAAGKIPVLRHAFEEKAAIAARLVDKCRAFGIVFNGDSELMIEWLDDTDEERPTRCRSMIDHVHVDRGLIFDVKTTSASAHPRDISRHFVEYGLDIQYTAYTRALAALRPEFEGRIDMQFVFCELEPPYDVVPARPDGVLREIGVLRWERAVRLWRACLDQGQWPGYINGAPARIEAPQWVKFEELGNEERFA
jgi:hypothetical protein